MHGSETGGVVLGVRKKEFSVTKTKAGMEGKEKA